MMTQTQSSILHEVFTNAISWFQRRCTTPESRTPCHEFTGGVRMATQQSCGMNEQVVCVQQLNLFSKEWEIVCAKLGDDWSSVAAHDGEMQVQTPKPQALSPKP
jgi:hypothetical protein